jgi:hypothetical protein
MALQMRVATEADIDAITDVAQAAMSDDPSYDYCYPYRDQYPEDNRYWTRQLYANFFKNPSKYLTLVMTVPDSEKQAGPGKPVSYAVWLIDQLHDGVEIREQRPPSQWCFVRSRALMPLARAVWPCGRWPLRSARRQPRSHKSL